MKRLFSFTFTVLFAFILPCFSQGQVMVDGMRDAAYAQVAVQTNQTQFGDANMDNDFQGSELDAMYVAFEGSRMFIMLTGNLEGNFNKLEVFFDTVAGGENVLSSIPQYDFFPVDNLWNSQLLGGPISQNPGFTLDSGFNVDYHLFVRRGFIGKEPFNVLDVDFVNRMGGGTAMVPGNANRADFDFDLQTGSGAIAPGDLGPNASGAAIANNISFALNNTNGAGVGGYDANNPVGADPVAAAAVTTGIEFSIDVADLGLNPNQAATIRVMACVNNSDHRYLSNQFLPGLPIPTANLGGDNNGGFISDCGLVNVAILAGNQFANIAFPGMGILVGDVNCDGVISLLDVAPFVDRVINGPFDPKADINGDLVVDLLDIGPFVALLTSP